MLNKTLPGSGIAGSAVPLATIELPIGIAGHNGIGQSTILDSENVPRLTPVGILKYLGAFIDLNNLNLTNQKLGGETPLLNELPSGHVTHDICELKEPMSHQDPTKNKQLKYEVREEFAPLRLQNNSKPENAKGPKSESSSVFSARTPAPSVFSSPRDTHACG